MLTQKKYNINQLQSYSPPPKYIPLSTQIKRKKEEILK